MKKCIELRILDVLLCPEAKHAFKFSTSFTKILIGQVACLVLLFREVGMWQLWVGFDHYLMNGRQCELLCRGFGILDRNVESSERNPHS